MPLVSDDPWVVRHDLAGGISQKVKKVVDGSAALSFFPVLASSDSFLAPVSQHDGRCPTSRSTSRWIRQWRSSCALRGESPARVKPLSLNGLELSAGGISVSFSGERSRNGKGSMGAQQVSSSGSVERRAAPVAVGLSTAKGPRNLSPGVTGCDRR